MKTYFQIIGCLLLSFTLTGCLLDRESRGENYTARGYSDLQHGNFFRGRFTYDAIELGSLEHPIDTLPEFTLKLGNGKVVRSRDFSLQNLRTPGDFMETKTNGRTDLRMNGAAFTFSGGQCIELTLSSRWWPDADMRVPSVELGYAAGQEFAAIPIPEQFLERVLGPMAKRHTYLPKPE